ncbi:MAG: alpha-L-fucosidase [Kordiimonadaceae bacterium]|nr:alpha-L-fucosidase [Kordiimonadaceae bacterium]MBT6032274.1 alpha-L-fucosidase [Kordiimonadaceae bacterium]
MKNTLKFVLLASSLIISSTSTFAQTVAAPPEPIMPLPAKRHLIYDQEEMRLFVHFGVNTYTDMEWGDGTENPEIFQPTKLDTDQWAKVAKETGFGTIVLTAKHHDGFALWNSAYTDHDVGSSSWRRGRGDVVGDLEVSTKKYDLGMGLYLSPWDQNADVYGTDAYNGFYMGQLNELLSNYGELREFWFDGAKGPNVKEMNYKFETYWSMIRQKQPHAVLFSDAGPDVHWIGNEHGHAKPTNWSGYNMETSVGGPWVPELTYGSENGQYWTPGECNVSIRKGWFNHQDQPAKTTERLMEIYYKSAGRNCFVLINVPPNKDGLFDDRDVTALYEFKAARDKVFMTNFTRAANIYPTNQRAGDDEYSPNKLVDRDRESYWATDNGIKQAQIVFNMTREHEFNVVRLSEPIRMGQRIKSYEVEAMINSQWTVIAKGTTIGRKRLHTFKPVTTQNLRLRILDSKGTILLSEFGVHYDPMLPANYDQLDPDSENMQDGETHLLHRTTDTDR